MSDRTREADRGPRLTTILDPLRPAVVVRRRVYDATPIEKEGPAPRTFSTASLAPASVRPEDEEGGPPSSINVARALASLRGEELRRVEAIVQADEASEAVKAAARPVEQQRPRPEPAPEPSPVPNAPATPTLVLGRSIALSDLAKKMGVSSTELPATLVARGFYALTAKTVLPRETARVIAEMYGWRVEDAPAELEEPAPAKSGVRSRIATKPKARAKVKVKAKSTKVKPAKVKPAKAKPAKLKPAKAKLASAKPAKSKPAKSKPASAKPAKAKPAKSKRRLAR